MAASGLDHLKNDYRRRFCRPSRVPDINTVQGQDMLEILKDCFDEKSLTNDFSIGSTKSVLYSTPKVKDSCIQSPSKESVPVSSRKKEAPLQSIVEPSETANKSVQAHEILQKTLATDVASRNTPDLKKMSSKKPSGHPSECEAEEEFYLSVGSPAFLSDAKTSVSQNTISSLAQKRETYTFGNSLNILSSSTEISLKTKKRLNFEDKDILKKVEMKNKVSEVKNKIPEGPQERKPSETFQKSVQDLEHEIQPQTKKSFSTLFLETVKRKSEFSPIVRHVATAPPHSSPPNDMKLLEDEFIIDESDRSFASRSWITIPRKGGPLKQPIVSPAESTAGLQGKKPRENHCSVSPETLTSDRHLHKAHPEQKFQPCDEKILCSSSALTDELENKSKKYEMYSEKAKKPSGNKRTIKQNQRRKFKANRVEEQLDLGQSKGENINMSHSAQDKLRKNLDRNREDCEEMRNDHISINPMPSVGDTQKSRGTKDNKKESRKKNFSSESKKNKFGPEEVTSTVRRSCRISRRPSNWWEVKSKESPIHSTASINNELSVNHNTGQKSAKKTSQLSKNVGKKTIPSKQQKIATQSSSRVKKFLNVKGSESIISHKKSSSSQNEPLETDKADLAKKKNLNCSGTTGCSKDQCGVMTAKNVHLKSKTSDHTYKTATESNLDPGEPKTSVLEESGPSRLKNYLMSGKKNSDVGNEEVQESLDNSRLKRSKVAPEKKIHHKLILPSNTPNVRRTKRIRLKPLEYWRGERVDYQETPSGGFVIGGILSPDTVSSKRKAKGNVERVKKVTNRKRICLDNDERKNRLVVNLGVPLLGDPLQPTWVKDPETREIVLMDLIRPRDTYQFFVEHGELKVYKTLDTPFFSTGKLILGPYEEKGKQHVGQDILVFYVDFGNLLCTLHESPYIITTGDSFYVPSGNYYNIRNLLNEESVLLFTQIKR